MPDPAVIVAMRAYKAALLRGEREQMQAMARRWLAVERRLDGNLAALAERMASVQRDGGTITRGMLATEVRYRQLLLQLANELERYTDYAERTISDRQRELGRLGIQQAEQAIQAYGVDIGFTRLPIN